MTKLREGLLAIAVVIVGGIVIAGQSVGWEKLFPALFQRPRIEFSSASRPSADLFFAGEKLWLTL
jgi:hypothetical protein